MTREVLLYGYIGSWSAETFIHTVNEITDKHKGATLRVRVNSNGGDTDYCWGMVTKFAEYQNRKEVIVDGKAQSMGAFFLAYANHVKAADYANFLLHRVAYPAFIENNAEYMTADRKKELADANGKLRAALEAKIDVDAFKRVTKHTLDELFSMEGRLDISLNAEEAREIGLVDEIIQVTPEKKAEIEAKVIELTASQAGLSKAAFTPPTTETQPSKNTTMTLAELKAQHPALFAEVKEIGAKEGAEQERERIAAWNHFREVNKKAVDEGIASGKPISQLQMLELYEQKQAKKAAKDTEEDSTEDPLPTGDAPSKEKEAKKKEMDDFISSVSANSQVLSGFNKEGKK